LRIEAERKITEEIDGGLSSGLREGSGGESREGV